MRDRRRRCRESCRSWRALRADLRVCVSVLASFVRRCRRCERMSRFKAGLCVVVVLEGVVVGLRSEVRVLSWVVSVERVGRMEVVSVVDGSREGRPRVVSRAVRRSEKAAIDALVLVVVDC